MKWNGTRKLLFLPPLLVGAAVLVAVVRGKAPPEQADPGERATAARIITVKEISVTPRVSGYGAVQPARVWHAVAQVAGRVEHVHPQFKKGALLAAGTEIIRLAPEDYEIAIRQAESNIRAAEAQIRELRINEANTRAALKIEKQSLGLSEKEFARKTRLAKRDIVSKAAQDLEERNLLNQRKLVLTQENALRLIPAQIAAQEEQMKVSQATLEASRLNLARTRIKLPFDARIAEANVEVTQFVSVGTVLGIGDGVAQSEVSAQFPQAHVQGLFRAMSQGRDFKPVGVLGEKVIENLLEKVGLTAIVRLQIGPQPVEWRGKVVRISDQVDPKTRTVGVIARVDDAYKKAVPGLRPPLVKGMFVELELQGRSLAGQLVIPRASLHGETVYLLDKENRLRFRKVKTRLIQGDIAVISDGMEAGERLVISDLAPVIEGMLVQPSEDAGARAALVALAGAAEDRP